MSTSICSDTSALLKKIKYLAVACFTAYLLAACSIPNQGHDPLPNEVRNGGTTMIYLGVASITNDYDQVEITPSVSDLTAEVISAGGVALPTPQPITVRSVFRLDAGPLSDLGATAELFYGPGHAYNGGLFAIVDFRSGGTETSLVPGDAIVRVTDSSRQYTPGTPYVTEQNIEILPGGPADINLLRYKYLTTEIHPNGIQHANPNIRIVSTPAPAATLPQIAGAEFKFVYDKDIVGEGTFNGADGEVMNAKMVVTKTVRDPNFQLTWTKRKVGEQIELNILVYSPRGFTNSTSPIMATRKSLSSVALLFIDNFLSTGAPILDPLGGHIFEDPKYTNQDPLDGEFSYVYYDIDGNVVSDSTQPNPVMQASLERYN